MKMLQDIKRFIELRTVKITNTPNSKEQASGDRLRKMQFSKVVPLYIQNVEKKGRTKNDVDAVIFWLTGYDERGMNDQLGEGEDFESFFAGSPQINANADKITGVVCGVSVEEIEDPVVQNVRRLGKLVDELAKGKDMGKELRAQFGLAIRYPGDNASAEFSWSLDKASHLSLA